MFDANQAVSLSFDLASIREIDESLVGELPTSAVHMSVKGKSAALCELFAVGRHPALRPSMAINSGDVNYNQTTAKTQ